MTTQFKDYIQQLLPVPLKDGPQAEALQACLGAELDDLRSAVLGPRLQSAAPTGEGWALDLQGRAKLLPRLPQEIDDAYRRRLAAAFKLHQAGGTPEGVLLALALVGWPGAELIEGPGARLYDGSWVFDGSVTYLNWPAWFEFAVRLFLAEGEAVSEADRIVIMQTVNRWKAAHTRFVGLTWNLLEAAPEQLVASDALDLAVVVQPALVDDHHWQSYDGAWRFDGSHLYSDDNLVLGSDPEAVYLADELVFESDPEQLFIIDELEVS